MYMYMYCTWDRAVVLDDGLLRKIDVCATVIGVILAQVNKRLG